MTLAQAAANTVATINGIAVSSTSNSLANVVDGMTFSLGKVTTAPVTINVTRNTDAIKGLRTKFVAAYNQLNQFLSDATKYDPATKQGALLQGDGTTVGIQNQLHTLLSQASGASTTYTTLSALGVQLQKDGSLNLDDAKFATAARQPAGADQGAVERRRDERRPTTASASAFRRGRRPCSRRTARCPARPRRSRRGSPRTRRTRTR